MPQVTPPEQLRTQSDLRRQIVDQCPEKLRAGFLRELAIEFKPVEQVDPFHPQKAPPRQHIWFRAGGRLPDDPALHQSVLTYATDPTTVSLASGGLQFVEFFRFT